MTLLRDGRPVEERYIDARGLDELPDSGALIVSLAQWQAHRPALLGRPDPVGVRLRSDEHPQALAGDLPRLAVIALEFPKFRDGRAYTYARLLRERFGYRGEIRAVGDVLQEQLLYMQRCGFDVFELPDDRALPAWQAVTGDHTVWYQATGDGRTPARLLRSRRSGTQSGTQG